MTPKSDEASKVQTDTLADGVGKETPLVPEPPETVAEAACESKNKGALPNNKKDWEEEFEDINIIAVSDVSV